jgi:phage gp36-like protein
MTTQTYCTRSDLESLWTPAEVLAAADDDADGSLSPTEETHIAWAIEAAAGEMNSYLEIRYTLADLALNDWCRSVNAVLAVALLASRQGDALPETLAAQRNAALATLRDIAAGARLVPQAVNRHETIPTVSNFTTNLAQRRAKVRRVPETSTGNPPAGGRKSFFVTDYE